MKILTFACLLSGIILSGCTPKMMPASTANSAEKTVAVPPTPPPPPPLPSPIPMDPKVRIGMLPSGLTYYIRQNAKPENRAELRLALKAGSMQEDDDQQGLAHFIEHMAFNGTENFSKNELVNYLELAGARFGPDLNAYTSFDETVYMLQVRTDDTAQFNTGLLILKDWASGVSFDDEEIDKERGVVISEWRSGLSPDQRMRQEYLPFVYFNSRYAKRLPIGKPEIINTASYDVVKRFYRDWYRPDLMSVFLVGDFDPDEMEQKIKETFSSFTTTDIPRRKASNTVPQHQQTFIKILTDPEASNANIQIMYKHRHEDLKTIEDYRTRLVQNLYNRMLGRRLSELTKSANPPFISGYTGFGQDVGDLAVYRSFAYARPEDVSLAIQTLLDENRRVVQHGFTLSELEREKANMIRSAEQNVLEEDKLESSRLITRYISHFLDETPIANAAQIMELYDMYMPTITLEAVNTLADQWVTEQNRVVIVTAPQKEIGVLPDSIQILEMLTTSASKNLEPYLDIDLSKPLLSGTFAAQPVKEFSHDEKLNLYTWTFENGITVKAKPTEFKNDEVLMVAYSPGGHSNYPDALYPAARAAGSVVGSSGVGEYNATGLDKKLTGIRANVTPFIFERFEGLNGSSSVKDMETMMQLAYSYVVHFREDTAALGAYLKREKGSLENAMLNPQNWFSNKVSKVTTSYHPRRGFPDVSSFDQVTMKDIQRIYAERFQDVSDFDFFFVGNFDIDSLQTLTSRYLAALPGSGRKDEWKDIGERFPAGRIDSVYYRGEAPTSFIQMFFHGPDHYDPDTSFVLQSLIDVARIELRERLREDEGGVYGVSVGGSQNNFPLEQYSIRVSFNADPPRMSDLTQACLDVIRQLKTEIDPIDIAKITEAQRQSRIKDLQRNQYWMNALITSWLFDQDLQDITDPNILERRIATITPEVLQRAARKYFSEKELITLIMYPEVKE